MKDPLVLSIPFKRKGVKYYDWYGKPTPDDDEMYMCYSGAEEWFDVPQLATKCWVVISPYRDPDSYPLWLQRGAYVSIYDEEAGWTARRDETSVPNHFIGLDMGFSRTIRDHVEKYPHYNFYFSIEVYADAP